MTENVRPNSVTGAEVVTGAASALLALTDNDDASFVANAFQPPKFDSADSIELTTTFDDLLYSGGRTISSFSFIVRAQSAASGANKILCGSNGLTGGGAVSANLSAFVSSGGINVVTVGPFTRSGGGAWAASDINAMTPFIAFYGTTSFSPPDSIVRIVEITLRVFYV